MPIEWTKGLSPMGISTSLAYALKGSAHPNAAKLFSGWLASDKGVESSLKYSNDAPVTFGPNPVNKVLADNKVELVEETVENYRDTAGILEEVSRALGGS
jgi:ABC-type Fe3+ transport system substrate-binding protein